MDLINTIDKRYSAKEFDTSKSLNDEQLKLMEDLLQKAPSSTNLQPWHFTIATTKSAKEKIAKATQGVFKPNECKILECSAVIVFSTKNDLPTEYLDKLIEKEDKDGRYEQREFKEQNYNARNQFVNYHKNICNDVTLWNERQVYINLGFFLLGTAQMGLDSIAIEGADFEILTNELKLNERDFKATMIVCVGFKKENDINAILPKSRFDKKDIIDRI